VCLLPGDVVQSEQEYQDLQSRRKLDEDLRGMFDTAFWKYPKSEETLSGVKSDICLSKVAFQHLFEPFVLTLNGLDPQR
jgi:hypothetical protein